MYGSLKKTAFMVKVKISNEAFLYSNIIGMTKIVLFLEINTFSCYQLFSFLYAYQFLTFKPATSAFFSLAVVLALLSLWYSP